jgi:carbonic anhydrase
MSEKLEQILAFNRNFVEKGLYKKYLSSKYPHKKLAILSCMDTRLTELLPAALNLKNGDVKIIKNAGGMISHPYGSVMRSLMLAIYELQVEEILVIGHHDCGMQGLDSSRIIEKMLRRHIDPQTLTIVRACGIDLEAWLSGFGDVETSVRQSVELIRNHPLVPQDVEVHGLIIHPESGELSFVI